MTHRDEAVEPEPDPYAVGVAVAGARLVGVVAAELGEDHPVIARMVVAIGELVPDEATRSSRS